MYVNSVCEYKTMMNCFRISFWVVLVRETKSFSIKIYGNFHMPRVFYFLSKRVTQNWLSNQLAQ